ncbi:NIPSNAP family protein [Variovorax boronicumulans]
MIHELREYRFTASGWREYEQLFRDICRPLRRNDYGELLGAWTTQHTDGTLGFLHMWSYESLDTRTHLRKALMAKPGWISEFIEPVRPFLLQQVLSILNPAASYPGSALPSCGYLQRINCSVGQAAPVIVELQKETPLVWTTEFSNPNEVACITPTQICQVVNVSSEVIHPLVRTIRTTPLQAFACQ